MPEPTKMGVCWEGRHSKFNSSMAINHQGNQVILRKGDTLSVLQLNVESSPPSCTPVFIKAPFEPLPTDEELEEMTCSEVDFTWSPGSNKSEHLPDDEAPLLQSFWGAAARAINKVP
ncbi:hypothetical protein WJX73_005315 [Symbiochloris irregularis]|uniref:Uncharacterized protein n=1 Tax=Symbiochloris irregularis TaxID=706552 RepID=A0AAW1NSA9_9CHLO